MVCEFYYHRLRYEARHSGDKSLSFRHPRQLLSLRDMIVIPKLSSPLSSFPFLITIEHQPLTIVSFTQRSNNG